MKSIFAITLILILLCSACKNNTHNHFVNQAETLIETNPDSAYLLLKSITMPDKLNDELFAHWCMLLGKVSDDLHKDMPYVSYLIQAQTWYEKDGTIDERIQIGLYLGRSYVEEKRYDEAMNTYLRVLDLAKEGKEYNLAGYICSYMADLYELKDLFDQARKKYQEGAEYFLKAHNSRSYALALRDVSYTYCLQDSLNLALKSLKVADSIIYAINDSVARASILNALGNVYSLMDSQYCAEKYLLKALELDTTEIAPTYLALSTLFLENGDLDKARYYLKESEQKTKNAYTSVGVTYQHYLLEKMSNNPIDALFYLELHCQESDSISFVQNNARIDEIEKKYNYVKVLNENNQLRINRQSLFIFLILAILFCLLFAFLYYIKSKHSREQIRKQQKTLDDKEKKLLQLVAKLDKKEKDLEQLKVLMAQADNQEDVQKLLDKRESEYQKQKEEVLQVRNEFNVLRKKMLYLTPVVKKIVKLSQVVVPGASKSPISVKDWHLLVNSVNNIYFLFNEKLEETGFKENTVEMYYCYLSLLKLDKNQEAVILHINPDSVSKLRVRVRQRLQISSTKTSICECLMGM